MKKRIILLVSIFLGNPVMALKTYQSCPLAQSERTELDNMCPRVEGKHLDGCCPPLFKSQSMNCTYYVVKTAGQQFMVNSSYTICQNGVNVAIPCCAIATSDCSDQRVDLQYLPRLISRNQSCCFDACPAANWWINPPPSPNAPQITLIRKITNQHVHGGSISQCTGSVIDQCSVAGHATCPVSSPCPPPSAPPPDPGSGSGSGSGGGSGSGSNPGTGTGTAPNPPPPPVNPDAD